MKILFISRVPIRGFSGGRYGASLLAERFARGGCKVTFWVNYNNSLIFSNRIIKSVDVKTVFPHIFGRFSLFDVIYFHIFKLLIKSSGPDSKYDHVIIVPEEGHIELHQYFYELAKLAGRRVHLMNFETPNWVNQVSNKARDDKKWLGWKFIASKSKSVLSISRQSQIYAKRFYGSGISYKWFKMPAYQFSDLDPLDWSKRGNVVVAISRMDAHKGLEGLVEFLENIRNLSEFILIIGSMKFPKKFHNDLRLICKEKSIELKVLKKVGHLDKFKILGRAKYLIFPSYFEGLGMPPIEALASGCKVAAFNLPVLEEISEFIEFVEPGDYVGLSSLVSKGMNSGPKKGSQESVKPYELSNRAYALCHTFDDSY